MAHGEYMQVSDVMTRRVITIRASESVKNAARLLAEHAISALPVVDADGSLVGIVSERDLLPLETRPDPRSQAMPLPRSAGTAPRNVGEVMTRDVITVAVDADASRAARLMIESGVKRLPVMDGQRLVGIVSRRDLIAVIARSDQDLAGELERRLRAAGIVVAKGDVVVTDGAATMVLEDRGPDRRLAELVAMAVPGVLEVRFTG